MTPQSNLQEIRCRPANPSAIGLARDESETWLRAVVIGARSVEVGVELVLHDATNPEREPLKAFLEADRIAPLGAELGIVNLPSRLLGDEVDFLLREKHDRSGLDIVAIGQAWLDRRRREAFIEARNTLASTKGAECQRSLDMPGSLDRVEVLHDPRQPSWPTVEAGLRTLRGVELVVIGGTLDDAEGTRLVHGHMFRKRRSNGGVDAILIVADAAYPSGLPFLNDFGIASSAFELSMPILLGAPAPPTGSLLHETVFATADTAIGVVEILAGLVGDVLARRKRAERLRAMRVAPNAGAAR